jgi:hypothetical protein
VDAEGAPSSRWKHDLVSDDPDEINVIDLLVKGRLVVASESAQGARYEIAHEALVLGWATLRRWLDEQAGSRAVRSRITAAAKEWERQGRAPAALWGAAQLAEVREVVEEDDLTPGERDFVVASRSELERSARGYQLREALYTVGEKLQAGRRWLRVWFSYGPSAKPVAPTRRSA